MSEKKQAFSKVVSLEMKGLAVILMLVHHLFSCFPDLMEKYQVSTAPLSYVRLMEISTQGKVCVGMFVFLSAYGMTISMRGKGRQERIQYTKKRYLKLIVSFLVIYAASLLAAISSGNRLTGYFGEGIVKGLLNILFDALGIANIMGSPTLNETWWYMSVAVLLIFILPLLLSLYEKFGICVPVVVAMASYLGMPQTTFTEYLFVCSIGIWAARSQTVEKLLAYLESIKRSVPVRLGMIAGNAMIVLILMYIRMKWGYTYWIDAAVAFAVALELFLLTDLCGWKLRALIIIGKYSMNIFLLHTFLFKYYFEEFIYSFRNWLAVTAVLLVISLVISIVLERIQRVAVNWVLEKYLSIKITY